MADHQIHETRTKQEHRKYQETTHFPSALSRRLVLWSNDQMDQRISALLDLNRQKTSELCAYDVAVNAAWRRRDDVYRALPSGDTFRRRCISRDWRPPLPLPPPYVPPLPSRARFIWSSVVGKRVFEAGVADVDRPDSRRLKAKFCLSRRDVSSAGEMRPPSN
jgi:hypothetical protein